MFQPLDELKPADIPEKTKANWKLWGPGAILVGLSIGAGEIIIWPRLVAEFGASMVWAAVLGVLLQLWINFEIGRWTIATGETIFTGFARAWRGFAPLFILFTIMGWIAPGWARGSGAALRALLFTLLQLDPKDVAPFLRSDTLWTCITFGIIGAVLFGPKVVYKSVEHTVEVLVIIVTCGLIAIAFAVGSAATWQELGEGVINVGYIDPKVNLRTFFSALVFAGAGGTANLFYSFYLRDKHIGMGALLPEMQNPLRGKAEKIPATGFIYPDTPENASRFRAWWRFIRQDQVIFFWALNTLTILLFIFAALAVLHPAGIVPGQDTLISDQAVILEKQWGGIGRIIFLLVGVATLFSTQLTILDGCARSVADIIYTNVRRAQKRPVGWWYVLIAALWMVIGCGLTWYFEAQGVTTLGFLVNGAYMGGFAMAVYVPLTLFINLRYLPKSARPGPVCVFFMIVASLVYVGFAAACILWEVGILKE
ncbi:MAG: Nramp family divalent metal transporter [Phycisphaeraceae bacterium]